MKMSLVDSRATITRSYNQLKSLPRVCFVHALFLLLLAVSIQPAFAQETAQLDEIVVTAQKRNERLQDVPISDTVVSAAAAQARGITIQPTCSWPFRAS